MIGSIFKPWWLTDRIISREFKRHIFNGNTLIVGSGGKIPWAKKDDRVKTLDIAASANPDYVMDAQIMSCILGRAFDATICTMMLEHVKNPDLVVRECFRVLRNGGVAVFTVPFVCRVHNSPGDYWRFTPDGIRVLLESNGFVGVKTYGLGSYWTTMLILLHFGIYEATRKHKITRMAACAIFPITNIIGYFINAITGRGGGSLPHSVVAIGHRWDL